MSCNLASAHLIAHFRINLRLRLKASIHAHPFHMQIKLVSMLVVYRGPSTPYHPPPIPRWLPIKV